MSRSSSFINDRTRLAIYFRDEFTCVYCGGRDGEVKGEYEVEMSLDHIGDTEDHSPANLVTACRDCNSRKKGMTIYAFCRYRGVHHATVYRRIKTQTAKPIQGYRDCVGVMLRRGMPFWLTQTRWRGTWDAAEKCIIPDPPEV